MAKFMVRYDITGTAETTIEADSLEEAKAKVKEQAEADDWWPEMDECTDLDWRVWPMYRVQRGVNKIFTTFVRADDVRLPEE